MHNAYTFLHVEHQFVRLASAYQQKFPHRSSVESLLRVRCWLGTRSLQETVDFVKNLDLVIKSLTFQYIAT